LKFGLRVNSMLRFTEYEEIWYGPVAGRGFSFPSGAGSGVFCGRRNANGSASFVRNSGSGVRRWKITVPVVYVGDDAARQAARARSLDASIASHDVLVVDRSGR